MMASDVESASWRCTDLGLWSLISNDQNVLVFRGIIHASGDVLGKYLADNYCPTIEEEHQEGCPDHLAQHYPDMLGAVVHRFISSDEGARHMCTTMGACHPKQRAFTCDECVAGMEWIEAYLEDPIFQAEALFYLEHNWCNPEHHG